MLHKLYKYILSVLIIYQTHIVFAQENTTKYLIEAGVGIGDIHLGMSYIEVEEILNVKPIGEQSFEEAWEYFETLYNPKDLLMFQIGFDKELEYDTSEDMYYPIYKLYFLNDQLLYIILSTYAHPPTVYEKFRGSDGISFGSSLKEIEAVYGKHDEIDISEHTNTWYDGEFRYLRYGITFTLSENKTTVIDLFFVKGG